MTQMEKELQQMFCNDEIMQNVKIVGNTCYGRLTDQIRVKINFSTGMVADNYDRLKVTLLNRNEGVIDNIVFKFGEIWGKKNDIIPHLWRDDSEVDWYIYHPTKQDYRKLVDAVRTYLCVFREPMEE